MNPIQYIFLASCGYCMGTCLFENKSTIDKAVGLAGILTYIILQYNKVDLTWISQP